jgi:hypothetical protein
MRWPDDIAVANRAGAATECINADKTFAKKAAQKSR